MITFENILDYKALEKLEWFEEMSAKASGEALVEFQLLNIKNRWLDNSFNI